jgi:hypothetical protein
VTAWTGHVLTTITTTASTGNVCTVRCRNNAVAGPFGGCFAVMQTDTVVTVNTAANIGTAATLDVVLSQVAVNQADLPVALAANANAGTPEAVENLAVVESMLGITVTTKASPVETPDVVINAPASSANVTTTTSAKKAAKTKGAKNKDKSAVRALRWGNRMV